MELPLSSKTEQPIAIFFLVAIIYLFAAQVCLMLAFAGTNASPVWSPIGIAFAAVFTWGYRIWPAIALGAFFANFAKLSSLGFTIPLSLTGAAATAAGNTLEALVGVFLVLRFTQNRDPFVKTRDFIMFILWAALAATLISASVGATTLSLISGKWELYGLTWLTWWLGDVTGALLITPVITTWKRHVREWSAWKIVESGALLAASLLLGFLVLFSPYFMLTAFIPLFVWAALRFDQFEASLVIIIVASFMAVGTHQGIGPYAGFTLNASLLMLQVYISIMSLTIMLLSTVRTERNLAEKKLHKHLYLNEALFNQTITCFALFDCAHRFIQVNEAYAKIFKKNVEDFPGRSYLELFPWDEAFPRRLDEAMQTRKPLQAVAFPFVFANQPELGTTYWDWVMQPLLDLKGDTECLFFSAIDVTETKRAEVALRKSEEQLQLITSNSPDSFFLQDRSLRYLWIHNFFPPYKPEDVIGKTDHDLLPPEEARSIVEMKQRVLNTGGSFRDEIPFSTSKGTKYWFDYFFQATRNEANEITGIGGYARDVTARKLLEEQLRHSQKLEAVGVLAGGVAHDFNNILTAIVGYAHLARQNMDAVDPQRLLIDNVLSASERAVHLTQSLLAFSRKQITYPRPVDLNGIVASSEMILRPLVGEDIEFLILPGKEKLIVAADAAQIEQVLMNLTTNARDAMPKGGKLTISTQMVEMDKSFLREHGWGIPGAYVQLTVSDTGTGIDKKTQGKIFEPFFTTKDQGKGTGLGLSIVYGIIKQHEGYITVQSEQGKGTTFKIYLPPSASIAKQDEVFPPKGKMGGTETILLAEDDTAVRHLTRLILQNDGYKVIEASDGQEAVDKFTEQAKNIDLLLLDIIMPNKSGQEVYQAAKKIRPDINIIFTSGYDPDVVHRKSIAQNGLKFLPKPVSPELLLETIRATLDEKQPDVLLKQTLG